MSVSGVNTRIRTLEETIPLSPLISPWRYAFRHSLKGAFWFGVVLVVIALFGAEFLAAFIGFFVLIVAMPLLFAGDYGRAHELAHSEIRLRIRAGRIQIERRKKTWSGKLDSCRFFRGSTNHDPDCLPDVTQTALLVCWPPFLPECRSICAMGEDAIERWTAILRRGRAFEEAPRKARNARYEAFVVRGTGIAGGCVMLAVLKLLALLMPVNVVHQFTGTISAMILSAFLTRKWIQHRQGDFVAHGARFAWFDWRRGKLLMLGMFGVKRRGGRVPNIFAPEVLFVGLFIVALEFGLAVLMYRWLRPIERATLAASGSPLALPSEIDGD